MGGNAVQNVKRINQENVSATLDTIYDLLLPYLNICKEDTALYGSTGKKCCGGSSGDIDLGLSIQAIMDNNGLDSKEQLFDLLCDFCEAYKFPYNYMKGLNIVSLAFPISNVDGRQEGDCVQLDLMPVDSIEFSAWGMYSPHEKDSPYKGTVRNELLRVIASYLNYKVLERIDNRDITFERGYYDKMMGLYKFVQSYRSPKTNNITKSKIIISRELISDNPDEIIVLLFGPKYKANDILTIDDAWKAFLDDDFPLKNYRKDIVTKTIEYLKNLKTDYPPYMDEYLVTPMNEAVEQIGLDTPRKAMVKIHQMNAKQFVDFINELKRHLKDGKVNLKDLNTTEKVDGQAARILVNKGQVQVESSRSGVNSTKKLPKEHQGLASYIRKNITDKLVNIAKENETYYKVIGELFYLGNENYLDPDGSATFVATKYDGKKLGRIATFVIFEIKGVYENSLYELNDNVKKKIQKEIASLSNADMKFYLPDDFTWDKEIEIDLNYNTQDTKAIFDNPSILLDRANKEKLATFRALVADAFSKAIAEQGSVIGLDDTEVEGIVFDINGTKFGAVNFNWQNVKHRIFRYNEAITDAIANFYKTVFGYQIARKVKEQLDLPDADIRFAIPYRKELPKLQAKVKQITDEIQATTDIPKAALRVQTPHIIRLAKFVQSLTPDLNSLRQSFNR